jgi:hypothetical protein
VTASEARVLVVSESVPLVIGLTLLPTDWQVATQPDVPDDLEDTAVLVLDLGSTSAGLDALIALGHGGPIRAVILGDEEPPEGLPPTTVVLLRPFTLPDLATRIDRLLHLRRRRRRRDAAPAPHEPTPAANERETAEGVADTTAASGDARVGPPPAASGDSRAGSHPVATGETPAGSPPATPPPAPPPAAAPRPQPSPVAGPAPAPAAGPAPAPAAGRTGCWGGSPRDPTGSVMPRQATSCSPPATRSGAMATPRGSTPTSRSS